MYVVHAFYVSFSISYYSDIVMGMNLLSGSAWKGTKLRIGEAKPDFRNGEWNPHSYPNSSHNSHRVILEIASKDSDDTRQRKRRRLAARGVHGRHSQDMSLITSNNVHQRRQWRIIPLG
jgi:hypothetical protein